jgi:hypothetical protein
MSALPYADIVLVLAIALSAVWLLINIGLISSVRGQGRGLTIGLGWWGPAVVLWVAWVILR